MPTLRKRKDSDGYFALTSIAGQVITFQISEAGQQRLLDASLKDGDRFSRAILFDLYRSGDAFTFGSGVAHPIEGDRQLQFDFSDDTTPEAVFPSCSKCSSVQDLHLVTSLDDMAHDAYILCGVCRKAGAVHQDASIPLPVLSRSIIARLQDMGQISRPAEKLAHYIGNLETDFQNKWDELRKRKSRRQQVLFPGPGGPQRRLID